MLTVNKPIIYINTMLWYLSSNFHWEGGGAWNAKLPDRPITVAAVSQWLKLYQSLAINERMVVTRVGMLDFESYETKST